MNPRSVRPRRDSPAQLRRDAPALVLAWLVTLLPGAQRDWGAAMRAELAGIETVADRWRFTRDCALAIARRPALSALASLTIPVGIVLATVLLTVRTSYLPMHIGLIAMVSALGVLYLAADRSVWFALPATGSRLAARVRAVGALVLAWLAFGVVLSFRGSDGNVADRAHTGLPVFTVVIAVYLVGLMFLTSPAFVDAWVLVRGVLLGLSGAVVWLVVVLARQPLPLAGGLAFGILALAISIAAMIGTQRSVAVPTALGTALVGALSLFLFAHLALAYGPAAWVPSDSAALTAAARLEQSRGEAADTYLAVLLFGMFAAASILANAVPWPRVTATIRGAVTTRRQRARGPGPEQPSRVSR